MNRVILDELTLQDLRAEDPGLSSSSAVPYGYVILNLSSPVARDPSDASELFVKSTSAVDAASVKVRVQGDDYGWI